MERRQSISPPCDAVCSVFPVFPKAEQSESMKERERMSQLQRRDVVIGKAGWSSKGIWIQLGGGRK